MLRRPDAWKSGRSGSRPGGKWASSSATKASTSASPPRAKWSAWRASTRTSPRRPASRSRKADFHAVHGEAVQIGAPGFSCLHGVRVGERAGRDDFAGAEFVVLLVQNL